MGFEISAIRCCNSKPSQFFNIEKILEQPDEIRKVFGACHSDGVSHDLGVRASPAGMGFLDKAGQDKCMIVVRITFDEVADPILSSSTRRADPALLGDIDEFRVAKPSWCRLPRYVKAVPFAAAMI